MSSYLLSALETVRLATLCAVTVDEYAAALPVIQAARETVLTGRDAARYLGLLESGRTEELRAILLRDIDAGQAMSEAMKSK